MKKWIITALIIISLFSLLAFYKNNKNLDEIPKYDADIICKGEEKEEIDGEIVNYINTIYINLDKDLVSNVIFQSVKEIDLTTEAEIALIDSLIEIYEPYEGITGRVETTNSYLVTEFLYDYNKIDLDLVTKELGNVLDPDTLLMKVSSLPVTYEEYKSIELEGYDCNE